ncbi:M48 family metalloprotease [Haloarchaeobius amylolyticus]|uniref:M48 family metalloprotease n=1 Tax=Haloarchaeobius amylolyticus TaxID=1198296 RepID=UPI002271364F|nr:M48 family metalloprotease [Haloarchaeobius amylolyticus]
MERDSDLTARILLTLALILVADLALVSVAAYILSPWLAYPQAALASALGVEASPLVWGAVVVLPVLAVFVWAQFRYSRRELLAEVDAQPVSPAEYPDLHARLQRLATQADMQKPALAIADTSVPNSFAVGGLRNATVVVSTGLLNELDDDQLDAVLGHELAHVRNRDAAVMTLASFVPALVSDDFSVFGTRSLGYLFWGTVLVVLYGLSAAFIDAPFLSVGYTVSFVMMLVLSAVLGGIALGVVGAMVLGLSQNLSQYREYVADRSGALLAGNPAALASALQTLDEGVATPTQDRRQYAGVEGLCLLPYGFSDEDPAAEGEFTVETRSHPPTAQRIERLQALQREL